MKKLLIVFAAVFLSRNSFAKSDQINFELARIDGSKFVSNKDFVGKKTILIFFDIDCLPCISKINRLKGKPLNLEVANLAIINLSSRKEAKNFILNLQLDPRIEFLQSPINPRAFLRKFGNNSGALPYLVLLNKKGILCLSKTEMFLDSELKNCN